MVAPESLYRGSDMGLLDHLGLKHHYAILQNSKNNVLTFRCEEEERFAPSLNLVFAFCFFMLEVTTQLILLWMALCLGRLLDGSMAAKDEHREGRCAAKLSCIRMKTLGHPL